MELSELRLKLDEADRRLIAAFEERMRICGEIGSVKAGQGLPVFDPAREEIKLQMAEAQAAPEYAGYVRELYRELMRLSKEYQKEKNHDRQL